MCKQCLLQRDDYCKKSMSTEDKLIAVEKKWSSLSACSILGIYEELAECWNQTHFGTYKCICPIVFYSLSYCFTCLFGLYSRMSYILTSLWLALQFVVLNPFSLQKCYLQNLQDYIFCFKKGLF